MCCFGVADEGLAMTEAEWLACTDPLPMLRHLGRGARARKLRLFGYACWHRLRHLLVDERLREFLRMLELHADRRVPARELADARDAARAALARDWEASGTSARGLDVCRELVRWGGHGRAWTAALRAAEAARDAAVWAGDWAVAAEGKAQSNVLRDLFGNPSRPVAADPAWRSWNGGVVVKLAEAIYQDRAFDRLPVLADALEEAGCTDADLLVHCREGGEHVRGCFAVDRLLGKD
jgi:hypothetical protein